MRINSDEYKPKKLEEEDLKKFVVVGAHENGIKCVGLLCGYGSREELEACGADYIAEHISDIAGLLKKE